MTFSFKPRRWSTLPLMAASVRTRVVSWNDAAEMKLSVDKLSVDSDALVMPRSRRGWPEEPKREAPRAEHLGRAAGWHLKRAIGALRFAAAPRRRALVLGLVLAVAYGLSAQAAIFFTVPVVPAALVLGWPHRRRFKKLVLATRKLRGVG